MERVINPLHGFKKVYKKMVNIITPCAYDGYVPYINLIPHSVYSLRKVIAGYGGYAIQVKRVSDNALLNVGFVNNELDKALIIAFIGSGSGVVSIWYDQSGLGRNMTSYGTPFIVWNGDFQVANGKPAVYYNGTSAHRLQNRADSSGLSIMTTWSATNSRTDGRIVEASGTIDVAIADSVGFRYGLYNLYSVPTNLNTTIVAKSTILKFGSYLTIGGYLSHSGSPNYYANGFSTASTYTFVGYISEVIIYNNYYTNDQLQLDIDFVKKFYSII